MKKTYYIALSLVITVLLLSCKKEETKMKFRLITPIKKTIITNIVMSTSGTVYDTGSVVLDLSKEIGRAKIKSGVTRLTQMSSAIIRTPAVICRVTPGTAGVSFGDQLGAYNGSAIPLAENQSMFNDGITLNGSGNITITWELLWTIAPAAAEDVNLSAVIEFEFY
jgi:hypothetical protein